MRLEVVPVSQHLLEMKNIHKRFPGVYALKGVSLQLNAGEVHALVGENGAGKSTLINVLGGIYPKDEGTIRINGSEVNIDGIKVARDAGISILHQELVLEPFLSIAENIFINKEPVKHGFVDYKSMYLQAQKNIDALGLDLEAKMPVYKLSIAQQQMVEIIKAVSFNSKIIVMDEPTSSISDKEVRLLFDNIHKLKTMGIGIIYISHRMSELKEVADAVTVLRDGESVGTFRIGEISNDKLVRLMVGREMTNYYTRTFKQKKDKVALSVNGLSSKYVTNISFELHEGEILGFSGLIGAGRTETMKAILGFDKITTGEVFVNGSKVHIRKPNDAFKLGIGFIPENRRDEGIIPLHTVKFNISLKVLGQFITGVKVDRNKENTIVKEYINKLSIKLSSSEATMQTLSGGNQQKAVIASWLASIPKILIMDEPTRGIDVGAKAEIYTLMNKLALAGISIIMISSELPEIINMSDRIVVMREGSISAIIDHDDANQEIIMQNAINI
jgi:ABC-type sugar transport system ATPase subunit